MDVCTARVVQQRGVAFAGERLLQPRAIPELGAAVTVVFFEIMLPVLELFDLARLDRGMGVAGREIAVDAVALAALGNHVDAFH